MVIFISLLIISFFCQTQSSKRQQFDDNKNKKKKQEYILSASKLIAVSIKREKSRPIMILINMNMFPFLLTQR